MEHELHAAGFVEEAFEDERLLRRNDAEHRARVVEVRDDLLRGGGRNRGFGAKPVDGVL